MPFGYAPLALDHENRQYRVIEDFAEQVVARVSG